MSKKTIYWICQTLGWGVYGLFSLGMIYVFSKGVGVPDSIWLAQLIIVLSLLLFSHLFRLFVKHHQWSENKVRHLIPKVLIGISIVSISSQLFIHALIYWLVPLKDIGSSSWTNFVGYTAGVFLVMMLWSTIYFAFQFIERNRKGNIEKLQLQAALQEAELAILKNQVNPHFLFNALNNIRSLILSDPEKARQMITHMSELLRYSIRFNAAEKVPLQQELEIVKDYLQLESVQFNDRLTYDLQIASDTLDVKIPPMAIQLLVENAIKHGISQLAAGGNISIRASLEQDHLDIEVTNTGQLRRKSKREGIGLKNLIERLQILFGHFAQLRVENSSDNTVTASLKIPIT